MWCVWSLYPPLYAILLAEIPPGASVEKSLATSIGSMLNCLYEISASYIK